MQCDIVDKIIAQHAAGSDPPAGTEVCDRRTQLRGHVRDDILRTPDCDIHLVDENKDRDLPFSEHAEKCLGVSLNALRSAYDKQSVVDNRQRPFHFRSKIHVSRCVDQCHLAGPFRAADAEPRLP